MYAEGFVWDTIKRSLNEASAKPMLDKRVKLEMSSTRCRRLTKPEDFDDVDAEAIENLRPFPPLERYLEYINLPEEEIEEVVDILEANHVQDWSYFLWTSYVHPDRLVNWGLPHPTAVNLIVQARRYFHFLLQQ